MLEVDLAKYPEVRRAVETREVVLIQDVQNDPVLAPVRDILLQQGYRSLVVVPLVFGGTVLGTLYLFTLIGLVTKLISDLSYVWVDPRVKFD